MIDFLITQYYALLFLVYTCVVQRPLCNLLIVSHSIIASWASNILK